MIDAALRLSSIARSRRPFFVVVSGALRSAWACRRESQLPTRTPFDATPFTRAIPLANSGAHANHGLRGPVGNETVPRGHKGAKTSGYLEDVIWLVRGRGVDALGRPEGVLTRPPVIIQLAREVKVSGVRIIVSTEALQQQQIPVAGLDPTATDLVDNTAMLMAELVSQGYQVIRY